MKGCVYLVNQWVYVHTVHTDRFKMHAQKAYADYKTMIVSRFTNTIKASYLKYPNINLRRFQSAHGAYMAFEKKQFIAIIRVESHF